MPTVLGLTLLWSLAAPPAAQPDPRLELEQGIRLFGSFQDSKAAVILQQLLRHDPPRAVAGKAHLYLGLIALNWLDTDRAMAEFKTALLIDPTVDLARNGSPKARLALEEVRHSLEGQLGVPDSQALAPPESAVAAGTPSPTKPLWDHPLALTLGGLGLVALGVGVYGGIDLFSYNQSVGQANAGSGTPFTPGLQSARSQASFWAAAWIPFVIAGALGLGASAWTW
jgi:hypothetical protein